MGSQKKKGSVVKVLIIVGIIVAVLAGGVYLLWKNAQNLAKKMTLPAEAVVERGDISRTVDGTGNITVADKIEIKVPSELTISEKLVEEGDPVKRGDVLATIDKSSVVSTIVSLQSELDSVKESLKNASKDKLTTFQIEELQTRQANIEARITLMMIYYQNPFVLADTDGIVYSQGSSSSSAESITSGISMDDIASYLSADVDDKDDAVVKAEEGDEGEGGEGGEGDDPEEPVVIDLTDFSIEAPVTGANVLLEIHEDDYDGTIVWKKGEDISTDAVYAPETVYTAIITLTAHEGASFDMDTIPEDYTFVVDGGSIILTHTFDATEPAGGGDDPVDPDPVDPDPQPIIPDGAIDDIIDRLFPDGFNLDDYLAALYAAQAAQNMGGLSGLYDLGGYDMSSLMGDGTDLSGLASAYSQSAGTRGFSDNTLMTIAKMENVKISIQVDELDILSISEGQAATITLDALPEETFEGTISRVAPLASQSTGTAKYTVDILIPKHDSMRIGMSASASIVIYSAEDVLLLPLNALQQMGDDMLVYRSYDEQGNLTGEQIVETGISDTDYVEIVSGLEEGDTVYYIDPEANPFEQYMAAMEEE